MDDKPYIVVPLKALIGMLQEQHYTNPMIGDSIGVTPLQVHYYHRGKTKQPNPEICLKLFKNFKIGGKSPLVDLYKNPEDLMAHYNIYTEAQNAKA